jgi:hypothetical protein
MRARWRVRQEVSRDGYRIHRSIVGDAGAILAHVPVVAQLDAQVAWMAAAPELLDALEAVLANPGDPKATEDAGHLLARLAGRRA